MKKRFFSIYLVSLFIIISCIFGADSVLATSTRTVTVKYTNNAWQTSSKPYVIGGYTTFDATPATEDSGRLTFDYWEFSWKNVDFSEGSSKTPVIQIKIPTSAECASTPILTAHYTETQPSIDLSAKKSLSYFKSVSPLKKTIAKGDTTSISINFDTNNVYRNGKVKVHFITNVKDGSKTQETATKTATFSNTSSVTINDLGLTKLADGTYKVWYAGDCYIQSIELLNSSNTVLATVGSTNGIQDSRLSGFKLTITGGDPVYTPTTDKGVIDQGTTVKGDAPKAGAKGSSASAAEKAITTSTKEEIATAEFAPLKAYSKKTTKTSVTVKWSKVSKATSYVVYGNKCGKKNKFKKLTETTGTSFVHKGLKKGTYYKYVVVAKKGNETLSTSRTIHVCTTGGKYTNYKALKTNVTKKTLYLSGKNSFKLSIKSYTKAAKGKTVKKHRTKVWFEDDNPGVIKFGSNGKVIAKKKGVAYIYAYTQNGVYKKIKVTVKA